MTRDPQHAGGPRQRLPHLSSRLVLFAGASMLPVLALSAVLAYFLIQHEQETFRLGVLGRNSTCLTAIDAQIQGYLGVLRALAASGSLQAGNLAAFHAESRRVLQSQPDWRNILLVDASGQQLLNARLDFGAPLPRDADADQASFQAALAGTGPIVGSLAHGPLSGVTGIAVRLPVAGSGNVRYILEFILRPEALTRSLQLQDYPRSWVIGLVDANNRFIVRQPYRSPGVEVAPDFKAAIRRTAEGWYRGRTLEGWDTFTAHKTSKLTGWTVGVGIPAREINDAAYGASAYMLVGAVGSLLLAMAFAYWLAQYFAAPISMLASAARGLGQQPAGDSLAEVRKEPRLREVLDVVVALDDAAASIAEREALRQREQEALRAADKAKDEFLAMLGHELRNPLSSIVASAHVLRLSKPGAQAAVQAHEVIERQARQMARLAEDLLDVSRLAMGKVTLQRERVDLAALTDRVLVTWLQTRPSRGERLKWDLAPAWIEADRGRVEQILANLLDNAEKFSSAAQRIYVRVACENGKAVLQVQDEGQGISPQDLPYVFDLFVQGPQRFDRPKGGIGLGLTLAKRLTEMHGGEITVFSAGAGQGALFTVRLPLSVAPAAQPVAASVLVRLESRRVLVVEDNDDGRRMMEAMLTLEGHTVRTAATGEEAVQVGVEWQPDIALIDIGLPDMDGYEVARRLRLLLPHNPPKLLAVSGFGQQSDLHNAYEAGFDLHLTKPVAPQFLRDVMSALTSRQQIKAPIR